MRGERWLAAINADRQPATIRNAQRVGNCLIRPLLHIRNAAAILTTAPAYQMPRNMGMFMSPIVYTFSAGYCCNNSGEVEDTAEAVRSIGKPGLVRYPGRNEDDESLRLRPAQGQRWPGAERKQYVFHVDFLRAGRRPAVQSVVGQIGGCQVWFVVRKSLSVAQKSRRFEPYWYFPFIMLAAIFLRERANPMRKRCGASGTPGPKSSHVPKVGNETEDGLRV